MSDFKIIIQKITVVNPNIDLIITFFLLIEIIIVFYKMCWWQKTTYLSFAPRKFRFPEFPSF